MGRRTAARLLLALGLALTAACADDGGDRAGGPAPTATSGNGRFINPVLAGNFADPHLLRVGETWYAYATGDLTVNLQVARSRDLVRWEHTFVDRDGAAYLLWRNDGNCCGLPAELWAQRLDDDGLRLTGRPRSLGVRNDAPWEGALIEAPTLWREGGTYYLLYSANDYGSPDYAVGYATATKVLGPYRDGPGNPILRSHGPAAGPGGQAVVRAGDGDLWLAYHAWDSAAVGDDAGGQRAMWLDRLSFSGGRPRVDGPTATPQQAP